MIVNPVFEENEVVIATLGALSKLTTTGKVFKIHFIIIILTYNKSNHNVTTNFIYVRV